MFWFQTNSFSVLLLLTAIGCVPAINLNVSLELNHRECHALTCRDRCYEISTINSACSCQDSCLTWNNCCSDFLSLCKDIKLDDLNLSEYLSNITQTNDNMTNFVKKHGSCVAYPGKGYVNVLRQCPESPSEEYNKECLKTTENAPPVRHKQKRLLHFANVYCAFCHGYDVAEVIPWSFDFICPNNKTNDLESVISNCTKRYREDIPVELICFPRNEIVFEKDELGLLCEHYIRPIKYKEKIYTNEHCARIDTNTALEAEEICLGMNLGISTKGGLVVLFRINEGSLDINGLRYNLCPVHQLYDPYFILCRDLICPQYQYPSYGQCFQNKTVFIDVHTQPYPYLNTSIKAQFNLHFTDLNRISEFNILYFNYTNAEPSISCKLFLDKTVLKGAFIVTEIKPVSNVDILDDIFRLVMNNPCVSHVILEPLTSLENVECEEGRLLTHANIPVETIGSVKFAVIENGEQTFYYQLSSIGYKLDVRKYLSTGRIDEIHVCGRNDFLSCPVIVFQPGEFQKMNDTILIKRSEKIILKDQFRIVDGYAHVCEFYSSRILNFFNFDKNLYLTAVGLAAVSMLCSLVSMLIILLFQEMRTLGGKLNAVLCLWLILAQGILLIDAGDRNICRILAMFCHFLWLSVFSQMSSIAINMALTFRNMTIPDTVKDGVRFKRFVCGSLVAPIIIITVCICIDLGLFSDTLTIGYGKSTCSWMSNQMEIIVMFFYTPVCVSLLVNIVCFIITLCGIEKSVKVSEMALKENRRSNRQRCLIYAKLSSLMGFTWITGIVAALVDNPILWYGYIILNGLQGFFIFLSFICNRRTLELIRSNFRQDRPKAYSATANNIKSATDPNSLRDS